MYVRFLIVLYLISLALGINSKLLNAQNIDDKIKIGLLISDKSDTHARDAVQMVFDELNKQNNTKQLQFELLVRHTEGPWGIGSKEAVKFIYDDEVSALITSLDGRTAHLAEQVCAKAHILTISTWASDPSLTQAYVPWFFRIIPNDNQQAETIVQALLEDYNAENILIITDDSYDSNLAFKSFATQIESKSSIVPKKIVLNYKNPNFGIVETELKANPYKNVVLFVQPEIGKTLLESIKHLNRSAKIYGTIASFSKWNKKEANNRYFTINFKNTNQERLLNFEKEFQKKFKYSPNAKAFFAYEGAVLLSQSILLKGIDSEVLKQHLLESTIDKGISGAIQFDKLGNRLGPFIIKPLH